MTSHSLPPFAFPDPPDTAVLVCTHVLEKGDAILYVTHDEEDGMWQFLCGKAHVPEEARVVSLACVLRLDPSLESLGQMPCGAFAERKRRRRPFVIHLG